MGLKQSMNLRGYNELDAVENLGREEGRFAIQKYIAILKSWHYRAINQERRFNWNLTRAQPIPQQRRPISLVRNNPRGPAPSPF